MPTIPEREELAAQAIAHAWLNKAESLLQVGTMPTHIADDFYVKLGYHYMGEHGHLYDLAETGTRYERVKRRSFVLALDLLDGPFFPLARQYFTGPDGTCSSITQESKPVALFDNNSLKIEGYYSSVYYAVKEREYRREEDSTVSLLVIKPEGLSDSWEVVTGEELQRAEKEVLENSKSKCWPRPKPKPQ